MRAVNKHNLHGENICKTTELKVVNVFKSIPFIGGGEL